MRAREREGGQVSVGEGGKSYTYIVVQIGDATHDEERHYTRHQQLKLISVKKENDRP